VRHLVVGLVDQAISLRILSEDSRVSSLTLGPVQTIQHQRVIWPMRRNRIGQLLDVLGVQPPGLIHALSSGGYPLALDLAVMLDADLIYQVSSLSDCDALARAELEPVGCFLVMTEPLRAALLAQGRIPADRIAVARPGVPVVEQASCFAQPDRTPTLICTSSFEKHSGVDRLIVALDLVRKQIPVPATFLLGKGKGEAALRRMVRDRRLSASVTFAQPLGDPAAVMQNADLFIRPCSDDGVFGDVLLAMGAGALVITFESPMLDYLQNGQTAVVCPKTTAQSLAEAIVRAVRNAEWARGVACGGMEHVRVNHGVSAMAEQTAAAYRELVVSNATFALHR